jgi:hypothetical protein
MCEMNSSGTVKETLLFRTSAVMTDFYTFILSTWLCRVKSVNEWAVAVS